MHETGKARFLVHHDYGMGGLWWWVWAESAEEIVRTCAEVEVVTDPDVVRRVAENGPAEVNLDAPDPNPLTSFREARNAQRGRPGFAALVGRQQVHLRWPPYEDGEVFLMELGPDGRRLRQVEISSSGDAVRTSEEDWPFNPPFDLHDPEYAAMETSREDFEAAWQGARRE